MRSYLILVAALAAASLVTPTFASLKVVARGPSCNLGAATAWAPFKGQAYRAEAYSNGGSCADAVVTIVLRAPGGKRVLWTDAMPAAQLMTFVEAKTPAKMKAALAEWLSQQHTFKSSGDLPEWKKGADAPTTVGEFPFYPEEGVDRETYMQVRSEKQALFCYVQGMESLACIAIAKDGAATKVGVQSFPG